MSFRVQKRPASVFGEPSVARSSKGRPVLFAKIFCGLDFQLKYPNRSICMSLHKYAFRKL